MKSKRFAIEENDEHNVHINMKLTYEVHMKKIYEDMKTI